MRTGYIFAYIFLTAACHIMLQRMTCCVRLSLGLSLETFLNPDIFVQEVQSETRYSLYARLRVSCVVVGLHQFRWNTHDLKGSLILVRIFADDKKKMIAEKGLYKVPGFKIFASKIC